ncbi:MAG TPA: isoprenylcysteine carboxyl methyltransferase [Anaerolineaceae bacterium]|nr:isoprenylcysteine carboxyl methyltransferase [Anaerolineaceae bacterium]
MLLIFIVFVPMLPLISSWQWDWWEAWVYAAVNIFGFVISRYLAGCRNPDLLVECSQFLQHPNLEKWDKTLSPLLGLAGGLIPLAAGQDARFGPSPEFGLILKIIAIAVLLLGYVIGSCALIANQFFSGMVHIQADRGHQVIDTGPYRWVPHPGYLGALITCLVIPILLDSWWTFIPVIFTIIIIVLRTKKEDDVLQEKLEGYRVYTQRVRYRLIPGVW